MITKNVVFFKINPLCILNNSNFYVIDIPVEYGLIDVLNNCEIDILDNILVLNPSIDFA